MTHGFKILDIIDGTNWRPVHPFDYTIESHPICPIDGTDFATIAAIVSLSTDERIRVGCCPTCGLVGYIDRPSAADVARYYAKTWMGETLEEALAKAEYFKAHAKPYQGHKLDGGVLEIGCGYGNRIAAFQAAGCKRIHATESCPVRAAATEQVFQIPVTQEMPQEEFGLIVHHHVLEHVDDFMGLLKACAYRQTMEAKGIMQMSLPHYWSEPSMGVLMFLPHLWSFTGQALEHACAASGYGATWLTHPDLQASGFRMGEPFLGMNTKPKVETVVQKLLRGLGLVRETPAVLTWQRDFDGATWASADYAAWEQRHGFPRKVLVDKPERYVSGAPIEVQFEGRVQLFHK